MLRRLAVPLVLTMTALAAPHAVSANGDPLAGARFVPLSTEAPSWYTTRYHEKVMTSGFAPLPAGVTAPTAAGLAWTGIRPGQWLVTVTTNPIGFGWCSANFVFVKSGTLGLGTAGHCAAKDALGGFPDVTAFVNPPPGQGLPGFYHIGRFVLSHDNGVGDDFAMIALYPEFNSWVSPTMPVWGGPVGAYTAGLPTTVQHFGHGLVVGTGGTPRAGVAPIWNARGGDAFAWYGVGLNGDSGSGVLAVDPLNANVQSAAGNFTHIVVYDGTPRDPIGEIPPGMLAGTTITKILSIASGWTMLHGSVLGAPVDVIPPSGGTSGSGGGSTAPKGGGGGKGKKSRAR